MPSRATGSQLRSLGRLHVSFSVKGSVPHDLSVFVLALAPSALEDGSDLLCLEPGTKIHNNFM